MNTTLTTFAVALVLALLAALFGPLMVDWNAHRQTLAGQIGAVVGENITLDGDVSVQLLPMPSIRARQVVIGDDETEGVPTLKIPDFTMKVALLPLMRGVISIQEVQLHRPVLQIWMTDEGNILWPFGGTPSGDVNFAHAQIQRLDVDEGRIELLQPDHAPRRIDNVSLKVEASTLLGPYKANGAGTIDGIVYPFTLTTGEPDGENLQWPVSVQLGQQEKLLFEGKLSLENTMPQFEGRASWKTVWHNLPLDMRGHVFADSAGARLADMELRYGQTGSAFAFKGNGALQFDGQGAELVLNSEYLDGDRFSEVVRGDQSAVQKTTLLPFNPLSFLPAASPFPLDVTLTADRVMMRGAFIENARLAMKSNKNGWALEKAVAQLPGKSSLLASGLIQNKEFRGNFALESARPSVFLRWIDKGDEWVSSRVLARIAAKGAVEASMDSIRVQDASLTLNDDVLQGQMTWLQSTAAGIPHLALNVTTPRLDLDAVMPVLERSKPYWCVWCAAGASLPPDAREAAVEADTVVPAVLVTFSAGELERGGEIFSRIRFDASLSNGLLALNRFEIGEAYGAKAIVASGQIPVTGSFARLKMKARGQLHSLARLADLFPAEWQHSLGSFEMTEPFAVAVDAEGKGERWFDASVQAKREGIAVSSAFSSRNGVLTAIKTTIDSTHGAHLAKAFGLPVYLLPQGEHRLDLSLPEGYAPGRALVADYKAGDAQFTLDGKIEGQGKTQGFAGEFSLTAPQARSLRLRGTFRQDGQAWQARDILGSYADKTMSGELECGAGHTPCRGTLEFDTLYLDDANSISAALLSHSTTPMRQGQLQLNARKMMASGFEVTSLRTDIAGSGRQITVKSFEGVLAGGALKGQLALNADNDAPRFHTVFEANGMNVQTLWGVQKAEASGTLSVKGALSGRLKNGLSQEVEGYGTLAVTDLAVAKADPAAGFATLEALRAVKPPFDAERVTPLLHEKLDGSSMQFEPAEAAFRVQNGTFNLPLMTLKGARGSVRVSGRLEPSSGEVQVDARFVPTVLPEAQFMARYTGNWRTPERALFSDDLAQLAMLRVLEEGEAVDGSSAEDQHEQGRLLRELKHMERMRAPAVPQAQP